MTLKEYIEAEHGTVKDIAAASGVSVQTVKAVSRGMKLALYRVAKKISDATLWHGKPRVSVAELCEDGEDKTA